MKRRLAILGSTGSIGTQTLDVLRHFRDEFEVVALTAGRNLTLLQSQIEEFQPRYFNCLDSSVKRIGTAKRLPIDEIATHPDVDLLMHSTVGFEGLDLAAAALEAGKKVALSNKESIVMAGRQLKDIEQRNNGKIIPVDSEPSALLQCILGETSRPKRFFITASGGALRDLSQDELHKVTPEQALKHPTWSMGPKITIDSATLMNKAFEVVETSCIFETPIDDIEVLIHRQSVIHSMVEMKDGSFKAQMNLPDMRHPIQFALFYPHRRSNRSLNSFDPLEIGNLTFEPLDANKYPCFDLAMEYARRGGTCNAAMVGADEAAVELFLNGSIAFTEIALEIEKTLASFEPKFDFTLTDAVETARWAFESTLARHAE